MSDKKTSKKCVYCGKKFKGYDGHEYCCKVCYAKDLEVYKKRTLRLETLETWK